MRHCPICNGAPINDRPDLPAMQHTCSLCGWHYSAVAGDRCAATWAGFRCRLDLGHDETHQYLSAQDSADLAAAGGAEPAKPPLGSRSLSDAAARTALLELVVGRELTPDIGCPGTDDPESPATMAERLRLAAIHRARRTIVLEIDSLRADQEDTRADALQAALNAIDHVFAMMLIHSRAFQ